MTKIRNTALVVILSIIATLTGCVQYPTEKAGIVDMRPHVSFRFNTESSQLQSARVLVNGLDVGTVGDYLEGRAALRVLPGKNAIKVVNGASVILDQQVYLGDGVGRTFLLN